ncbi:hypothetical protein [Parapedobacter tibetensis]|uniref:hypothetical protein n=1 Tax=Parapedobacter tibetensis TaxID=2972951 RepID=UPI00214D5E0F|nr:hypothetical protein [Parapedobacter tibetensis]
MKALYFVFFMLPITVLGQQLDSVGAKRQPDTTFKVIHVPQSQKKDGPAFFINGIHVSASVFKTLDRHMIEHLEIIKDTIEIANLSYHGQIYITTKEQYFPKLISLSDLKSKYAPEANGFVIFMIDGQVIKEDYDLYSVDESNLLTIFIDKISNPSEGIDIPLIKVLTKSKKNIDDRNTIRIRGTAYHRPSNMPEVSDYE